MTIPVDQEKLQTTQTMIFNIVRDMFNKLFKKLQEKHDKLVPPEMFFVELGCQLANQMLLASFGTSGEVSNQFSEDDVMEANVHLAANVLWGFAMTCIAGRMNWDKFFTRVEQELGQPGRLELMRKQFEEFKRSNTIEIVKK